MQVRTAQVEAVASTLPRIAPIYWAAPTIVRGEQPFHVGATEAHGGERINTMCDVWMDVPRAGKLAEPGLGYFRLAAPGLPLRSPERSPRSRVISIWPRNIRFPALWLIAHVCFSRNYLTTLDASAQLLCHFRCPATRHSIPEAVHRSGARRYNV